MDGLQKSAGQYPMYKNEDFSAYREPGFKFILFLAFKKNSQILGRELYELLAELTKESGLFRFYIRISENEEPRFSTKYLEERLGDSSCIRKVILPNLPFTQHNALSEAFQGFGVPKERIIIC